MRFNILADFYWEAKIDKVIFAFNDTGYRDFFEERNYGTSVDRIGIIFMCQPLNYKLKQRIRFTKNNRTLYLDIMLNLDEFIRIDQQERNKIATNKLLTEVPPIVKKYNFKDFDLEKFTMDLFKVFGDYISD
jgi:hypothetical protein